MSMRGRPLGTSRDWRHRLLLHHVPLAMASAVVLLLFIGLPAFTSTSGRHAVLNALGSQLPRRISRGQLSVATGYLALGLLGVTLLIGPANLLLRRRTPISSYLRRDVGTWTAIASVAHVILALQPHVDRGLRGVLDYFVAAGRPLTNSFGLGNWTGLAALLIVVGLMAISTDRALRELKATRWKRLQRLNYALFALVVSHACFYGALSRMTSPFTLLLLCVVAAVFAGQAVGIWLWRRRVARGQAAGGVRRSGAGAG